MEQQVKVKIVFLKAELESIQVSLITSKCKVSNQTVTIQILTTDHQTDKAVTQQAQNTLKVVLEMSKKELEQLHTSIKMLKNHILPMMSGLRGLPYTFTV